MKDKIARDQIDRLEYETYNDLRKSFQLIEDRLNTLLNYLGIEFVNSPAKTELKKIKGVKNND